MPVVDGQSAKLRMFDPVTLKTSAPDHQRSVRGRNYSARGWGADWSLALGSRKPWNGRWQSC
jgi:hypothetical protein